MMRMLSVNVKVSRMVYHSRYLSSSIFNEVHLSSLGGHYQD